MLKTSEFVTTLANIFVLHDFFSKIYRFSMSTFQNFAFFLVLRCSLTLQGYGLFLTYTDIVQGKENRVLFLFGSV